MKESPFHSQRETSSETKTMSNLISILDEDVRANRKLESSPLPTSCEESTQWYKKMRKNFTSFELPFAPEKGEYFVLIDTDRYFAVSVEGVFVQTFLMWLVDEFGNCQDMGVRDKFIRLEGSLRIFIMKNGSIRKEDEVTWIQRKMKSVKRTLNRTIMIVGEREPYQFYSGSFRFCFGMKNYANDDPSKFDIIKDSTYRAGDILAICTASSEVHYAISLGQGIVLTNAGSNLVVATTIPQLCKIYPRCIKNKVVVVRGKSLD